jgi:Predicted membrane protein
MSNPSILRVVILYLVAINVVTFLLYGIDKFKAKRSKWRIPESVLLGLAVIGGSVGAWLGMIVWRHKTQHKKFRYGIPLILAMQIAILIMVSCKTEQAVETVKPLPENRYVPEHSPDVFLISYDAETGKEPVLKAIKKYRCEIVYDYHTFNGMALKKPEDKTLEETMQYFRGVKGVLTVEYDYITRLDDPIRPKLEER